MRRIRAVIIMSLKSSMDDLQMMSISKRRNKEVSKGKKILGYIGISVLFIYLMAFIFLPSKFILEELVRIGQPGLFVSLLFGIGPIVSLYFAILSVPGIFYFANDIDNLLVLPLKPWEIVLAKFVTSYVHTLMGAALIYIPMLASYFIVVQPGLLYIPFAIIAFLILPIIPLAIALLIVMLMMRFIPFIKNKDAYVYFTTAFVFIPTMFLIFSISSSTMDSGSINAMIESLQSMDNSLFESMNIFFPTSLFLTKGLINHSLLNMIIAILISGAVCTLIISLSSPLYFKGVIGLKEQGSKKRKLRKNEEESMIKVNSVRKSLIFYDIKNIMRTPAFALNYFTGILIFPIMMFIPLLSELGNISTMTSELAIQFDMILNSFELIDQIKVALLIGLALGIFMSNVEASSNTAISREGYNLKQFLMFPVQFSELAHAKATFSIILSSIVPLIALIIATIILRPPFILVFFCLLGLGVGILFIVYLNIFADVVSPNLDWKTEQQAVKGNLKQIFIILPFVFIPGIILFAGIYAHAAVAFIIGLVVIPVVTYILIKQVTKKANTTLVQKVQDL